MELSIYDIIKRRIITEKSTDLFKELGQITFEVNKHANKIMVRDAVEKIWQVKVDKVRMVTCPGKSKVFAKKTFKAPDKKKAVITLKKGYKIDLPEQFETMGVSETQKEKAPGIEGN